MTCDHSRFVDVDVNFEADAELREVNARLDRKARATEDAAGLVRFEIVHVRAVAVDLLPDTVASAVDEAVAVAGRGNHVAGRPIDFKALDVPAGGKGRADRLNRRIAGLGDDLKNLGVLRWHRFSDEAHSRQIAVDGPGPFELGPQVDQHEIAFADQRPLARPRFVMRIARVRADRHDRRAVRFHVVFSRSA